jgi:PHD/YefM family antitoxin component YafN of YafNO toxin-antitoxin module
MPTISVAQARKSLYKFLKNPPAVPIRIHGKHGDVILISDRSWNAMQADPDFGLAPRPKFVKEVLAQKEKDFLPFRMEDYV